MVAADPDADIFACMRSEDRATLRANMIDLILGMHALHQHAPQVLLQRAWRLKNYCTARSGIFSR